MKPTFLKVLFSTAKSFVWLLPLFLAGCFGGSGGGSDALVGGGSSSASTGDIRPLLSYSTSNSFGAVIVGSTNTITVTVTNVGNGPAILDSFVTSGSGFTWASNVCVAGGTLLTGTSCTFALTLVAPSVATYTSTTLIGYSGSGASYSLSIEQGATGSSQAPNIASSPSSYDFSLQNTGAVVTKSLIISNSASTAATIGAATISGSAYAITSDGCDTESVTSSTTCTITVSFSPSSVGAALGSLTVPFTYSGGTASITVSLSGTGQTPVPALASSPSSWDFGTVATSATGTKSLIISNSTATAALMGAASITGSGYSIDTDNCNTNSLASGGATCTIILDFSPSVPGSSLGSLSIPYTYTGGSGTLTVSLSAIGNMPQPTLTITPGSYNFNSVATNANSSTTFTIANNTTASAIVQTATISGAGFTITANTCNSTTIAPTGNCTITTRFAPGALGTVSGTLTIPYLSAQGISYNATASLAGTGVAPTVSFTFLGFNGGMAHTSGLTGTGVTLAWAAATGGTPAYYKITRTQGATTTVTAALTPVSTLTYNAVGMLPNTTYTFKINAYDSSDVSDGNTSTISVTTPNVTGADFEGWADAIATGSVYSEISAVDDINGWAGAARLDNTIATPLTGTSGGSAKVKLAWELFTFTPAAVATSYNVYRSTTSGSGFALLGNTATETYIDSTVSDETKYYYKIYPMIGATELTPATVADTEIGVYVPPRNMALVHRWITNRETCENLMSKTFSTDVDRTDNYSCAYNWGLGFTPTPAVQRTKWDIGYSFFVDRWENGCKMSPIAGSIIPQPDPDPSAGANGTVYFKQSNDNDNQVGWTRCFIRASGNSYEFNGNTTTSAHRALMTTNEPGYPPSNATQSNAYYTCQQRSAAGTGAFRLLRMQELIAARAWKGVIHNPSNATSTLRETGLDHLNNFGCNTKKADGIANGNPAFLRNAMRGFISGSVHTKNCHSRYEIQDLIGNLTEWTGEQFMNCDTAPTCTGITSTLDSGATLLDGFAFDGTMGKTLHEFNTFTNGIPMLAMPTANIDANLGSILMSPLSINDRFTMYQQNMGDGVFSGIRTEGGWAWNGGDNEGRFAWEIVPASQYNTDGNNDMAWRCVGEAP